MLGLLVVIIIGGIVALQMLPEYETLEKRRVEDDFSLTISHIRQAISLEREMADDSPCLAEYNSLMADPDNPVKLQTYLDSLKNHGFLTLQNYQSPSVPYHKWGTGPNNLFWQTRRNLIASTTTFGISSFEAGAEVQDGFSSPVGWINSMAQNDNATFAPGIQNSTMDDFPWQNKFGDLPSQPGKSLRIASYTP